MERLVYTGPEACETLFDPAAEELVAVLRRGPRYWGHDSGDASLQWCRDERASGRGYALLPPSERPKLSILYNAGHGFHFAYSGPDHPFLVPFDPSAPNRRVLHYLCGNQAFFPEGCFVPLHVAEQVVQDFLADGMPSPVVAWCRGAELRCGDTDS